MDGHQVTLPIPARKQAPESPSSGWCGETAIQEALLYFGAYVPQAKINAAGKPQHPDLYASDIPVALRNLGVDFDRYRNRGDDLDGFLTWLQARIRAGQPVLLGMKIHPTEHPQWGLDHFVLAVGFGEDDLLVNTTWGHQARRSRQQLGSTDKGLSLKNAYGTYWALPIRGWTDGETNARLTVRGESEGHVELEVSCTGLESGKRYELQRMSSLAARRPDDASDFVAEGATHDSLVRVARERTARFRCIPKV